MTTRSGIDGHLQQIARRLRWRSLLRDLTLVWLLGAIAGWLTLWYAAAAGQPWPGETLAFATIAAAVVAVAVAAMRRIDVHRIAHTVERCYPDLQTRLLAAVEQQRRLAPNERGYLSQAVIGQAELHARWNGQWKDAVPTRQLIAWSSGQALALLFLLATFAMIVFAPPNDKHLAASLATRVTSDAANFEFDVEPGDIELERGADLLVLARFAERTRLPNELTLMVENPAETNSASESKGAKDERLPMQQSLSDPIFAARVPEVQHDLAYRVATGNHSSRPYRVTVFVYPELERSDAELRYPEYTELAERRIEDVRQVTAVEGTELRWLCRLNKPVKTARLVSSDGESLSLAASPEDPTLYTATRLLTTTERWRLELTDDRGRENREPVEFVAKMVPNRPPELKLTFPRRDVKVSPLQEVPLEAQVVDDFGVARWGVAYDLIGKKSQSIVLGTKLAAKEKHVGRHLVDLEALQARPDELLAWHVWAEDVGPDGKMRVAKSDIFFAEVSPFEEIFREEASESGTPSEQQQQQAGDEALKLQKEIIAATWNLQRRERPDALSPSYASDAETIADSQHAAIGQLDAMRKKLQSADAQKILEQVEQHMQGAERALRSAVEGRALAPLDEALPAEQAAYQGLLRLRARENRVSRSRSAQAGGGQQSAAGQNLDQLELSEDEQRYEQRNRAGEERQTPAEREREEFLNRLRELARRQEDMNQKIKELQAALDAVRDEREKRELDRQLKRLRDEQREMLRDVDQLKNQFDQPEHNQPLAEASRQLDATREDVRQASDSLEKGQVSQALTAGARAESELDKLREDFRKQTANQYADEVRDLVDRARTLDERQERIGHQLAGDEPRPSAKAKGSLRSREPSADANSDDAKSESESGAAKPSESGLAEQLERQRKELGELLDQTRQLTERAEGNEPLMTKQLYDTLREAHHGQTQRAVDIMRQLVNSGLNREAAKVEPRAQEGVRQLRSGIEKAAESVLGDDVESLRRAKRDVDQLAQALAEEMARENSKGESARGGKPTEGKESSEGKESADSPNAKSEGKSPSKAKTSTDGETPGEGSGESKNAAPSKNATPKKGKGSAKGKGRGENPSPSGSQTPSDGKANEGTPSQTPNEDGVAESRSGAIGPGGALGGPDWRRWSDTLRNVEEFVPGTRLRSDAARIREQAQAIRAESKRHSKAPNWDLVRETVYEPLVELQHQLNEELLRRASAEAVVPLDRDPVPDRFGEAVRRYYERLGSGQ